MVRFDCVAIVSGSDFSLSVIKRHTLGFVVLDCQPCFSLGANVHLVALALVLQDDASWIFGVVPGGTTCAGSSSDTVLRGAVSNGAWHGLHSKS